MDEPQEVQWEQANYPPGSLIVFEVTPDTERAIRDGTLVITRDRRWLIGIRLPANLSSGIIHGTVA